MSNPRPLILVANDDGIFSPGIELLAEAVGALGEVVVVAPDRNQSAISHQISLHQPIRAFERRPGWWAVQGTPTDAVYLGVVELLPRRPDLVVSGINAGLNLSHDVVYSGTVAAAVEGTLFGIPSIAFSQIDPRAEEDADARAANAAVVVRFIRTLGGSVLTGGLPPGITLSVNFPRGRPERHQLTTLGVRPYDHAVHRRQDPRGTPYFWIGGAPTVHEDRPGSDCNAVAAGVISVTPLLAEPTALGFLRARPAGLELPGFDALPSVLDRTVDRTIEGPEAGIE